MRYWLMMALFLFIDIHLYSGESDEIIPDKASTVILTPSFSERLTLKIKLKNGLEAFLISDPEATKSAAALIVKAGSWQDPPEYPGLAHFLEHMLFLGTEKYPIESDYDRFIKEYDGKSNAYTTSDYTLYLFSINNDVFKEALDRFSSFFKKPLFNPSGVDRELQAIDQEFAKNFNDDDIREHYILKELSNPNHPFHRFSSGNSSTLSKVSQHILKQWYEENYSANLMRLVVYSPLPLKELRELVQQDFSEIPNKDRPKYENKTPLFQDENKGKMVYITPLRDNRSLHLIWELPFAFAHMERTKPEQLACYILGHEGPGSLLNELKKEDLAEALGCKGYQLGPDNAIFSLSIDLTEKGLRQINLIIQRCFEAIAHLKKNGIPPYLFNEVKRMDTISYQYQLREDPFDYVMKLGAWLPYENLSTFPEESLIIQEFDPKAVMSLLNELTPDHLFVILMAKPEASGVDPELKEEWMNTPYTVRSLLQSQIQQWSQIEGNPNIHLPKPNPFIPQHLRLIQPPLASIPSKKREIPYPETILENEQAKIYFAPDDHFQVPEIVWSFEIKTPAIEKGSPLKTVLADLYIKCLQEVLNPFSYSATLANLNYEIQRVENGIELTIKGYSENADLLFDAIIEKLKQCQPTETQFLTFKDSLLREYQNFSEESSLDQGFELYQSIIYENYSTHKQLAQVMPQVTYQQLLNYISHLFDQTYTTGLLYGNLNKDQALSIWNKLHTTLASAPYPLTEQPVIKVISLPAHQGPFFFETGVNSQGNVTILGIEDSGFSFKTRAAQQVLVQAMSGPFYHALRTQQQTGYIVLTQALEFEKHLFSFFAVQSNTHAPRDLLARFELFIESFLQEMSKTGLTREQFETIRSSLLSTIEHPPQSLKEMGNLLKTLAFKYKGDFNWIEKRIQGFKELDYESFLEMATQSMGKMNKRRLAILVEGALSKDKPFKYESLTQIDKIKTISEYSPAN